MNNAAIFFTILVIVSGVVAWLGDMLGRNIGKRRIKLFGLRPRDTAFLVTAITGSLITLVTITVLLLVSGEMRRTFQRSDEYAAALAALDAQAADYETRKAEFERLSALLGDQLKDIEQQRDAAQSALEAANADLTTTTVEKERLAGEVARLDAAISTAERRSQQLASSIARQEREIDANSELIVLLETETARLGGEVRTYEAGEIVVREGDVLASAYVPRSELSIIQISGVLKYLVQGYDNPAVTLEEPSLSELTSGANAVKGVFTELAVVVVRAAANGLKGQTVPVTFQVLSDTVVLPKGTVLYTGKRPALSTRREAETFLREQILHGAKIKALEAGVIPQPDGSVGGMDSERTGRFLDALMDAPLDTTITLTTTADIRRRNQLEAGTNFDWRIG